MEEKIKKEWAKPEVTSLSVNRDTENGLGGGADGTGPTWTTPSTPS